MVYKSLQGKKIPDYKKHLLIEWRKTCQIPQCLDPEASRVGNRAHLLIGENVLKQWDKCQAPLDSPSLDACLWIWAGDLSERIASVADTLQGRGVSYGVGDFTASGR